MKTHLGKDIKKASIRELEESLDWCQQTLATLYKNRFDLRINDMVAEIKAEISNRIGKIKRK